MKNETVGQRIRFLRETHQLSQTQLAGFLGKHKGVIPAMESGRSVPPLSSIQAICILFRVSANWFLGFDDVPYVDAVLCGMEEELLQILEAQLETVPDPYIKIEALTEPRIRKILLYRWADSLRFILENKDYIEAGKRNGKFSLAVRSNIVFAFNVLRLIAENCPYEFAEANSLLLGKQTVFPKGGSARGRTQFLNLEMRCRTVLEKYLSCDSDDRLAATWLLG